MSLVLTLQTEGQSSTTSPRSASSPDYGDDQPALLRSLPCGETCGLLVTGTKMTAVLYMWCSPCPRYVDSACNLLGLFLCMFGLGCLCRRGCMAPL